MQSLNKQVVINVQYKISRDCPKTKLRENTMYNKINKDHLKINGNLRGNA
jgi:hypothetical protein